MTEAEQPEKNDTNNNAKDEKGDTNGGEAKVESQQGKFLFKVKNYSKIREAKYYTEPFEILGVKWRLLIFPRGNDTEDLSIYLDAVEAKNVRGWSRNARFSIEIINQVVKEGNIKKDANHRFSADETDWGFTHFMKLSQLQEQRSAFLKEDTLWVNVEVENLKDLPSNTLATFWNYDSKKETGYVGLRNQGATCYMNSLLQALYHISTFRKAVYQLPTDTEIPTNSIPLALQRIFYRLMFGNTSVGTKELTKSFGWTAVDSFTQHDVQELNRVLCDNLQGKMKGTKAEGTIEKLFQGKIRNFIKCVNIEYESNREESFYDLSLNVKGCKDIYTSFEKYVEVEMLDGDNKYHAEGHGLQAAKKGCSFLSFPPVLHLQLKRFEYDPMRDAMVKVNDRYMFPETLDVSKFAAEDVDKKESCKFHLHGVLVHSGDVHGGHYYAFIRPTPKDEWFKFDDERVTKATFQQAAEDNYGGEEEYVYNMHGRNMTSMHKKFSNAYMLVYLRDTDITELLAKIPDSDIPVHLKGRFDAEEQAEELKKKEKAEAHLYMTLRVATDNDLRSHVKFDLVRFENVKEFRVKKASSLKDFKKVVHEQYGVPPEHQRYWNWVSRQNKTYRPDAPLTHAEEELALEDLTKHSVELKLFLETSSSVLPAHAPEANTPTTVSNNATNNKETTPTTTTTTTIANNKDNHTPHTPFPPLHDEDIFVFFKHYEPATETLQFVGRAIVRCSLKPPDLYQMMNNMAGLPLHTPLVVFEEVKPAMIDPLRPNVTLKEAEISNGDIIVFQRLPDLHEGNTLTSVQDYYDYILNRVTVKLRRLDQPKKVVFTLELSKRMLYDQVTKRLADKLGTDPAKIRLTGHNSYYDQPKPTPIKRQERMTLNDLLSTYYQPNTDTLFYEALEVPVSELENKRALKVAWHNTKTELVETLSLLLPRDSNVGDVLNQIKGMVKLDPENGTGQLRLMEVWTNKIHKVHSEEDNILAFNDYAKLRAEEILKEETSISTGDKRVSVAHYHREYNGVNPHSAPFFLVVGRDETLEQIKPRITKRLGLTDDAISKWKFAIVSFGHPKYLADGDIIAKHDFTSSEYFGLEHPDTTPRTQQRHHVEKPIKIYN
jgi:ubiquitin carboxyl-terminal hydrolase 7